jgi:hypothetical protein
MQFKVMIVGALVASLQMFVTYGDEAAVDATSATEDAYAAYQQYYQQQYAQQQVAPQPVHHGKPNPFAVLKNKQDLRSDLTAIMGEDAGITLGLIGALTGVISLIGLVVNAQSISSLSTDQDSICTTAKQLGGFTCTKSGTPTVAELGACFDTLVGYTTPSC